ncbi:hypothetical protein [Sorangium sp. So ce385]|uniref:hypothetical protein n=1 Tax=Sorangium sp. So ce385 TaxID=3133308 RepID=UPI003F5B13B2
MKGTPLENKAELLALARLPKEKLAMTARAVASGEAATVAEAVQMPHGKGRCRRSRARRRPRWGSYRTDPPASPSSRAR